MQGEKQLGRGLDKICMAGRFYPTSHIPRIACVQAHLTTIGIPRETESRLQASSRPLPIFVWENVHNYFIPSITGNRFQSRHAPPVGARKSCSSIAYHLVLKLCSLPRLELQFSQNARNSWEIT